MPIDDNFYRAFEEKFRGSEEEIRKRLEFYTPLLKAYAESYPSSKPKALDIGCGRGEMLSLYKDFGFDAFGIDINKSVLEYTKSKGFDVAYFDALDFLKNQEENTYDTISLIHVLEHLSFEYAYDLYKEVLRVLKPGGSFLIEFPFTENIAVGTIDFWVDPTHLKPLHPELIGFTLEYLGFEEINYFGVNAVYKPLDRINFSDAFSQHVAPNVAMIGIKPSENSFFIEKIKTAINYLKSHSSYRLMDILNAARNNYEKMENLITSNKNELENKIINIKQELDEKMENLITSNKNELENKIINIKQELDSKLNSLNAVVIFLKSQIEMLTFSKPWRIYSFIGKLKRRLIKKKIENIIKNESTATSTLPLSPTAKKVYNKLLKRKSL
jgi:O-antigen chain-terminating methyltransferase